MTTRKGILNEVINCESCENGNTKLMQGNLDFLKKMNLPIPHECPRSVEKPKDFLD